MLSEKVPSIEVRNDRITGILFSILNTFYAIRLLLVLISPEIKRESFILIGCILLLQLILIAVGFFRRIFRKFLTLLHLTGGPLVLYLVFILGKRFLKPILKAHSTNLQTEIGAWFYAVFIFLALLITINFIRDLTSRSLNLLEKSEENQPASLFLKYGTFTISLLLILYWVYTQIINPLPIFSNYDPEYPYLLNSLTPFEDFELYGRMDHPGTYLQLIGSFIVVFLSPLSSIKGGYPVVYHIQDPQVFLFSARFIILLMNLSTLRLIYRYFRLPTTWAQALAGVSASLIYFATITESFEFLTNWSPNSFNFSVGTYVLLLLFIIITRGQYRDIRTLWMISLAAGLAGTFHIYMVSLMLMTTAAVILTSLFEDNKISSTFKYGVISGVGAVTGYITGTLVILRHYESFVDWVIKVLTHQGTYGEGTSGFISIPAFIENINLLWRHNSTIFILLIISLLILITIYLIKKKRKNLKISHWTFILAISLQTIVLLVLLGKHPGGRYLLSIAGLFPLIVIAISAIIADLPRLKTPLLSLIFIGMVGLFISTSYQSIIQHHLKSDYFLDYQNEIESFKNSQITESGIDPADIQYYWTYNTWSPCYSLWLGNEFSKKRFTDQIMEICPQDRQYDVWSKPLDEPIQLSGTGTHNILIVNDRNFYSLDDVEYITKIESNVRNLGFILVR